MCVGRPGGNILAIPTSVGITESPLLLKTWGSTAIASKPVIMKKGGRHILGTANLDDLCVCENLNQIEVLFL